MFWSSRGFLHLLFFTSSLFSHGRSFILLFRSCSCHVYGQLQICQIMTRKNIKNSHNNILHCLLQFTQLSLHLLSSYVIHVSLALLSFAVLRHYNYKHKHELSIFLISKCIRCPLLWAVFGRHFVDIHFSRHPSVADTIISVVLIRPKGNAHLLWTGSSYSTARITFFHVCDPTRSHQWPL